MSKKTTLTEDADIYKKREDLSEREKLRQMTRKEKMNYLVYYYRGPVLITLIILAFVGYMIYETVQPKDVYLLHTAIINNPYSEELLTQVDTEFTPILEPKTEYEKLFLDTQYHYNSDDSSFVLSLQEKFSVFVAANELDVVIAPKSEFENYMNLSIFYDLTEILPTDLCSQLSNKFLIYDGDDETQFMDAYGIDLTGTLLGVNADENIEPYYIGIVLNTKQKEHAIDFIQYLFSGHKDTSSNIVNE